MTTHDLRGRRIAITGATGFLGRYVVDALRETFALDAGAVAPGGRRVGHGAAPTP